MSITLSKITTTGIFFLFIFLSGLWLNRLGKPYNPLVFNVHKLIGLAAGVFLIVTVVRTHQTAALSAIQIGAVVVTVLFFLAMVVTGGLMSIDKAMPVFVSLVHKFTPYLTVLATAGTLYLLLKG